MSEARGMGNATVKNGVCSSESVNGGEDMWSCDKSAAASADHLVVMVHGILGRSNPLSLTRTHIRYAYLDIWAYNFVNFVFVVDYSF